MLLNKLTLFLLQTATNDKTEYNVTDWVPLYVEEACTLYEKCKNEKDDTEICGSNNNNGTYVLLANKCALFKHNCDQTGCEYTDMNHSSAQSVFSTYL